MRKESLRYQGQVLEEAGSKLGYSVVCRNLYEPNGCLDCILKDDETGVGPQWHSWTTLIQGVAVMMSNQSDHHADSIGSQSAKALKQKIASSVQRSVFFWVVFKLPLS